MEVKKTGIPEVLVLAPRRIGDERGYFSEVFRVDLFAQLVEAPKFVQDNESMSAKAGTLRGLHFQVDPAAQGKLVRCTAGSLFDVAVDIRHGSPTYGQWVGEVLSAANGRQLWIPAGFAHGFCTLVPDTVISYKVTNYYSAAHDKGLAWNDPALGIDWPALAEPDTLSAKDRTQPLLADLPAYFHQGA